MDFSVDAIYHFPKQKCLLSFFVFVRALHSIYQIIVVELKSPGKLALRLTKTTTITRYYHNRTKGEPYITAEFNAEDFSGYKHFTIGGKTRFSAARRRRKRSGIVNRV